MDGFAAFIIGVFLASVSGAIFSGSLDTNFEITEQRYKESIARCEALGSTPVSSDSEDVTCENGITLNWR